MSCYDEAELRSLGFAAVGRGVRISRKASLYGADRIAIGDYARIDDFCVLSAGDGGIRIGRHVHLAVFGCLIGQACIELGDYAGLSSRVSIYSSNDDYSGDHMSNPTVPPEFTQVAHAPVRIGRHVIVGSGSVILPGCTLHEGSGVGALSLVRDDCEPFGMYFGAPARRIGRRAQTMVEFGDRLEARRWAPS
ncbi:MAG: acyltransferase [Rubrivivax sp.]|nr:acyltransferase [Pseudomonadota bacterium]MCW5637366.1 acyltransferase [Rubrivivax sp.]HOW46544.1 acyltransferase [Rubrivivax sp.]HRY86308.1 acyltransferase [Rubrivivax sp.]